MKKVKDCPFCGRAADMKDHDTLYPNGIYIRNDKELGFYYVSHRERKPTDAACYGMHCPGPSGGCGAEIHGDSKAAAVAAWNRRAPGRIKRLLARFAAWVKAWRS